MLDKIKSSGIIILSVFNAIGLAIGCMLIVSSMNRATAFLDKQENMSLEEYLSFHKVFSDKPILFSLKPFTVNLNNQDLQKVVQVEVNLEVLNEVGFDELVTRKDFVRDTVVKVLSKKDFQDVSSIQGKLFLKDDIALAVNDQLKDGFIKGVYFTKFYIQD